MKTNNSSFSRNNFSQSKTFFISLIVLSGRYLAIIWSIMAVAINSINLIISAFFNKIIIRKSYSFYLQKEPIIKRDFVNDPFLAHSNTLSSVVFITRIVRAITTTHHAVVSFANSIKNTVFSAHKVSPVIAALMITFLTACGNSNDSGSTTENRTQEKTESSKTEQTGVSTSYYVANESDLIACDGSRRGYLAYIQNISTFKACLEAGWTTVNIKPKDGKDGTMVSGNQWYDAITTKMWVMTNINTALTGFTDAASTCSGTYRIPTQAEVQAALGHGMGTQALALASPPTYIVISGYPSHGKVVRISDAVFMSSGTGNGAQFCVSQ